MDRQQQAADEAMKKPAWADSYAAAQRERDRLRALNTELISACEQALWAGVECCGWDHDEIGQSTRDAAILLRKVLKKAKGE